MGAIRVRRVFLFSVMTDAVRGKCVRMFGNDFFVLNANEIGVTSVLLGSGKNAQCLRQETKQ